MLRCGARAATKQAITVARQYSEDWEQGQCADRMQFPSSRYCCDLDVPARRDGRTGCSNLTCRKRRNIFVAGTACEYWLAVQANIIKIRASSRRPGQSFSTRQHPHLCTPLSDRLQSLRPIKHWMVAHITQVLRHDETAFTTFCARRHLRSVKSTGTVMDP